MKSPQLGPTGKAKMGKVMHEWGQGELHSGSKHGPQVTSQKQAIAIGLSEAVDAEKRAKGRKRGR